MEGGRLDPSVGGHLPHVIDDDIDRKLPDHRLDVHEVVGIQSELQMPAEGLDALGHARSDVARYARRVPQIEPHAAHAQRVHALELAVAYVFEHDDRA